MSARTDQEFESIIHDESAHAASAESDDARQLRAALEPANAGDTDEADGTAAASN